MSFETDLRTLIGAPVSQTKYIYGSIFHLNFTLENGDAEFVCNGAQWAIFDGDELVLHDEASLSSQLLSGRFTGRRLRGVELTASMLSLRFDDTMLHAFATEDYHLYVHDGTVLGSPEWQAITDASRHAFMLFLPGRPAADWEFSAYCDLRTVSWGKNYLAAQENADG